MKRTFLATRNGLLSPTDFSWGVYVLSFSFLIFLVRILAPNFFWFVFTPVFKTANAISSQSQAFISGFKNTAALSEQNERLQAENVALMNENKMLLQKAKDTSLLSSGILAGVVARPPESPYDTLVLSAGTKAGITLGMEAFASGGVPIGIVSSVLSDFSRVTLFSAPNFVTSGWVGDKDTPLTLRGRGAGVIDATASRIASIEVGDMVSVPGPGMLPIGQVVRVDTDPMTPGVILRIQPTINLFSIGWVTLRDTGTAFSISASSTQP